MNRYEKKSNKEINDELMKLPKASWHTNPELLEEGLVRWLRIAGFSKDRRYFIYACEKCGCQMEESNMGKKCPECGEWTYEHKCRKEVNLFPEVGEGVANG